MCLATKRRHDLPSFACIIGVTITDTVLTNSNHYHIMSVCSGHNHLAYIMSVCASHYHITSCPFLQVITPWHTSCPFIPINTTSHHVRFFQSLTHGIRHVRLHHVRLFQSLSHGIHHVRFFQSLPHHIMSVSFSHYITSCPFLLVITTSHRVRFFQS